MSHQLWKTLINCQISPNQIYFLYCCQNKIKPSTIIDDDLEYQIGCAKGLITSERNLTNEGMSVLNDFQTYLVKEKKKVSSEVLGENFLEKIKEYRELFPAKRLPSGELARQSVQELKDKLIWFFKTYPEYDWDLVLDATEYYNEVYKRKNYMYMVTSSYFIKKTNIQTKEVSSKLADYCQQLLDNPDVINNL